MFLAVMGRDHSEGDGLWVLASETDVYIMKNVEQSIKSKTCGIKHTYPKEENDSFIY